MMRVIQHGFGAAWFVSLGLAAWPALAESASTLDTVDGEQIYQLVCQGCHMPDGEGAEAAGRYPAFAGNPAMASAHYMALTILNGRRNMPSFTEIGSDDQLFWNRLELTDEQVANVVNYIRSHFGNEYADKLSASDVAAMHPK